MTPSPYRPSNGTEGMWFMSRFCDHCQHEAAFRADADGSNSCRIVALTMALDVHHPDYPREWIETVNGPTCTAFLAETDPEAGPVNDPRQIPMELPV